MAKIQAIDSTWDGIVEKLSIETKSGGVWEMIKKICLAATVYYIWHERNSRLFTGQKRSAEEMFKVICDEIKAKMVSIKVKQTVNVLIAENLWNIKFDRKM
ncbi:reverse transcriptase domain, Reverse transcriptase zinc-binding domain protein [Artemisia annua]|uniref:Reverse transcriptase domain, Reverse transcriptase zinc-binding domain protein n=1 Tax=Artemisia annua TaxID=35608 RepID=A0A2U1PE41_ARTAN|nr:reverse transcriptase domain, Reverse transcriptase zinc-binding domain protein [Artemisia annua]